MDWDKIRIFHTVAEAGSFTEAGKDLNLSQSAVSRHIATLEESLGVGLFRRHARGLVLTEHGEILHNATGDIFEKLSLIKGQIRDVHTSDEGPLTISVSEFIGSTWLAPKLASFKEKHPKIQLTVLFENRGVMNLNLKEADASIRLKKPKEVNYIQKYLTSLHFHICGHKDYFKKNGTPKNLKELKSHQLIAFPVGVEAPFDQANWLFDIAGVNPQKDNNVLMMNSMYAIHKAASTGAGIAVLPDYFIEANENMEVILPKQERPTVDMYFVYAEERRNSERIALLRDFLIENVEATVFSGKFT